MIITQNNYKRSFIEECKNILAPIINKSGGVLYSSGNTLQKVMFYILGLNPEGISGPTICDYLNNIFLSKENVYLDEDWSTE